MPKCYNAVYADILRFRSKINEVDGLPFSLIPHRVYDSIYDIDPAALKAAGITLLLADLDNTLAKYGQPEPDQPLRDWKEKLEAAGVELYLLSNSRKPTRASHFAQALGLPYQGHPGKPGTAGYFRAMERMARMPEQTATVGDQIFTDILGARRSGVKALMVEPSELAGNPGRDIRSAVEEPLRLLGRRNNRRRL